jgi:hypothetical protein
VHHKRSRADNGLHHHHRMLCRWGSGTNSLTYLLPHITSIQAQVNATIAAGHATTLTTSISNDLAAAMIAADGVDVALVFVNS